MVQMRWQQIERLLEKVQRACADGDTPQWQALYAKLSAVSVTIRLPLGEMLNPNLRGWWWAQELLGRISKPLPWPDGKQEFPYGVVHQPVEGVIEVSDNSLMDALLVAQQTGVQRIGILTKTKVVQL